MKRFFKFLARTLIVILMALIGFYLWGSSASHSAGEKNIIIQTNTVNPVVTDSVFSIATYNIGYLSGMTNNLPVAKPKSLFEDNLTKVKTVFKDLNIDILAFQEIDYASARSYDVNQQNEIAKLGYAYSAQAVNWDKRYLPFPYWPISMQFGHVYSGQSILSRFPISYQKRVVLQKVESNPFYRTAFYIDRLAQIATLQINNEKIIVINVHTEAFDQATRTKQILAILDLYNSYKNDYPTLLIGDFNSDIKFANSSIAPLINSPDIGIAAFDIHNYIYTYSSVNPVVRIDYIFYNKNFIEEVSSRIITEMGDASDHLPLMMTFKLK